MGRMPRLAPAGLVLFAVAGVLAVWLTGRAPTSPAADAPTIPSLPQPAVTGGAASPAASPHAPTLALLRGADLVVRQADGAEQALVQARTGTFLGYPVWAPDGQGIAYLQERLAPPNVQDDWGSDIYAVDVRTGQQRLLWRHDAVGVHLQGLAWLPDGVGMLLGYQRFVFTDGRLTGTIQQVRRLDLATGATTVLVDGGLFPSLSRDGTQLAYLATDGTGQRALWVAKADGSHARVLLEIGGQIRYLLGPRIAPDGGAVAFAAVDGRAQRAARTGRGAQAAHGEPMDIWTVGTADGVLTRITTFGKDEPLPAWWPDGQHLAVLASDGLYEVRVGQQTVTRIGEGVFGGQLDVAWQ